MKYLCVELAPITKVLNTEIKNGKIKIYDCLTVDTSQYIVQNEIDNNIEILYTLKAVNTICNAIKEKNIKARNVLLSCPAVESELILTPINEMHKNELSFKNLMSPKTMTNELDYERKLGKVYLDAEEKFVTLKSTIKRDLSTSLFKAFKQNKFNLTNISSPIDAILAYANIIEDSYDSNCKMIIDTTRKCKSYILLNNVMIDENTFDKTLSLAESVHDRIVQNMNLYQIKNPKIAIVADNLNDYNDIIEYLNNEDLDICDYSQSIKYEKYNPSHSICLALLLQAFYKKQSKLLIKEKAPFNEKRAKKIAISSLSISTILCISTIVMLVMTYIDTNNYAKIEQEKSELELKIVSSENEYNTLSNQLEMINSISDKIPFLIDFCTTVPNIYIASIDTYSMMPQVIVEEDGNATTQQVISANSEETTSENPEETKVDEVVVSEQPITENSETIIVRGYSNNLTSISDFAKFLTNEGVYSSIDLKGIEEIEEKNYTMIDIDVFNDPLNIIDEPISAQPLEKIYAFEMEVVK